MKPSLWGMEPTTHLAEASSASPCLSPCAKVLSGNRGNPVRRILLATDFSPASLKAAERAIALASQCGATLTILHVININAQPARGELGTAEELMKQRWAEGSVQMGRLAWSLSGQVEAQTLIEEGLPWEKIVEKSGDFDLLILGKRSAQPGWRPFSQHTVRRVIRNAARPLLVVPA